MEANGTYKYASYTTTVLLHPCPLSNLSSISMLFIDDQNLRIYLESTYGLEASNRLFSEMDQLIVHSLKAVQGVIINDR